MKNAKTYFYSIKAFLKVSSYSIIFWLIDIANINDFCLSGQNLVTLRSDEIIHPMKSSNKFG